MRESESPTIRCYSSVPLQPRANITAIVIFIPARCNHRGLYTCTIGPQIARVSDPGLWEGGPGGRHEVLGSNPGCFR
jgi:hypothetical protein